MWFDAALVHCATKAHICFFILARAKLRVRVRLRARELEYRQRFTNHNCGHAITERNWDENKLRAIRPSALVYTCVQPLSRSDISCLHVPFSP